MTNATPGWAVPGRGAPGQWPEEPPEPFRARAHTPDQTLTRPTYREPHACRVNGVLSGVGVAVLWFGVTALLGVDRASVLWVMLVASLIATGGAFVLARYGDRGAAAGVAAVSGVCAAIVVFTAGAPPVGNLLSHVF